MALFRVNRIAADGYPFDIDNIGRDLESNEIEIIQYLFPHGQRRRMITAIDEETATKSREMIVCAETKYNMVTLYCRMKGQPEEAEKIRIHQNGPGINDALKELINEVFEANK